jgi:MFS family permease
MNAKLTALRPFRHRNFSLLFASAVSRSIGNFMMMVALGWLVLEMTDSTFSLGLVFAMRTAPHLLFGMLAGAVADRFDRKRVLLAALALLVIAAGGMGLLIGSGLVRLWHVLLFSFALGTLSTFLMTARQALVVDVVGREEAMPAISLQAVAMRVMGVFGGGVAGLVIDHFGMHWPFYAAALGGIAGGGLLLLIRGVRREDGAAPKSMRGNFAEGLGILRGNRLVLTLVGMAIVCEILGFSYHALMPVFARDILDIGATGLGTLSAVQSAGGLVAVLALANLGNYRYKGRLLLGIFLFFGVALVLFGQSPWYTTSLVLAGVIGAMAGAFDAVQHTMLQLSVTEQQRGRAMGIWHMSVGFGPVGSLLIGAVAAAIGAQLAVTVNGAAIVAVFLLVVLLVPRLRSA